MNTIRSLVKHYPLPTFFTLALVLPWVCAPLADAIFYAGLPLFFAILLALPFELLVASPLMAALLVTALISGKTGICALLRPLTQWRMGLRWYAVALLLPPALSLAAAYLNVLLGAPPPIACPYWPLCRTRRSQFAPLPRLAPFFGCTDYRLRPKQACACQQTDANGD